MLPVTEFKLAAYSASASGWAAVGIVADTFGAVERTGIVGLLILAVFLNAKVIIHFYRSQVDAYEKRLTEKDQEIQRLRAKYGGPK
jgi:hypothetical protein